MNLLGLRLKPESDVIGAVLADGNNHVVGGPAVVPAVVTYHLELQLSTLGQLDAELLQLVVAVLQLDHVIAGVLGIPLSTEYDCGSAGYGVRVNIDGSHIAFNLELHVHGIKGEHIVATSTGELVGTVAVALLLGVDPATSLYGLVGTGRRADTVVGVEGVPTAVETITEHKPYSAIDGSSIAVSAIAVLGHLHTSGRIPVAKRHITYDVVCCLRREGQHDHHSNKSKEFFHRQIINLLNNTIKK